jgi:hypothetical protein
VTKIPVKAVRCNACLGVFAYNERKTGSSSLSRHASLCAEKLNRQDNVVFPGIADKKDPPKQAKDDFKVACANFCALGLRPPEMMKDEGLVMLIQTALDLGASYATYGRLDARKLLPCPTTVANCIEEQARKAREETAKEVAPLMKQFRCAATTDCYTDDFKKDKYIALTLHFVKDWAMANRLLFVQSLNGEAATADNLLAALYKYANEAGIERELVDRLYFVTDAGSDIKKALELLKWFYCMAHGLNVVLQTSLSVKYASLVGRMLESCSDAQCLIEKCNSWVKEVRALLPKGKEQREHALQAKLRCSNPQSQGHLPPLVAVTSHRSRVWTILICLHNTENKIVRILTI